MSKADEMFEELGYEKMVEHKFKEPEGEEVTELILYRDEVKSLEIEFWNDKTISKSCGYDMSYITMLELQAINEKVKELRLVKQLNKEIKELNKKYCCNCGVELTEENTALPNMCNECKYGEE